MNSVHASRFPRFRVLISAKRSEKSCRCTVMIWTWGHWKAWVEFYSCIKSKQWIRLKIKTRRCLKFPERKSDVLKSIQCKYCAMQILRITGPPLSGEQDYAYLVEVWERGKTTKFKDFLCWNNNKDVIPTLEALQKMIEFYHKKGIDRLKLGCTLPTLANTCLHKSTRAKFYPFTETDKDLLEKIREDMVGGLSIVFTCRAVVDETFIRKLQNVRKSIVGMTLVNFIRFQCANPCLLVYTPDTNTTLSCNDSSLVKTKHAVSKIWWRPIFSVFVRNVKLRATLLPFPKRKLIALVRIVFVVTAILSLKQWVATTTTVPVRRRVHLWARKKSNGDANDGRWMRCGEPTLATKVTTC